MLTSAVLIRRMSSHDISRMKFTVICFLSILSSAWSLGRPRGVSLETSSFYRGTEFKCLSDGRTIPFDHVNDDYCDCEDGSDEPGTSACSNGRFYCENKSHVGAYLISSRVNDGICDCCDGSDEYDGIITCENICEQLSAASRAEREAFKQVQEKGYKVKLEYIQQGRQARSEKESRLADLTKEKETFVEAKNTLQAIKDEAEAPEKLAKEKHEKAWEAVKAERQKVKDAQAAEVAFAELDVNQDKIVDYPELMKHSEFDIDSDGTVSTEEAKEYLEDNEQTDLATFTTKIWPNIKEIYKRKDSKPQEGETAKVPDAGEQAGDPDKEPDIRSPPDDISEGGPEDYHDRYDEDEDLEDGDDDEGEDEDTEYDISRGNEARKPPALLNTISEEDKMPEYDDNTNRLIEVADEARRKFEDADKKVRDVENEINDIKKYLELDLGPEDEFSALRGQCFEYSDREYTYRLCPFEKTSQKPKGGGIETNLGNWGHWYGPEGDKYVAMKYENGQGCWNGPNRSCHVNLHCGEENALTGASEPSRCEYQFEFTTPARCSKPPPAVSPDVHVEL